MVTSDNARVFGLSRTCWKHSAPRRVTSSISYHCDFLKSQLNTKFSYAMEISFLRRLSFFFFFSFNYFFYKRHPHKKTQVFLKQLVPASACVYRDRDMKHARLGERCFIIAAVVTESYSSFLSVLKLPTHSTSR